LGPMLITSLASLMGLKTKMPRIGIIFYINNSWSLYW
jgi:hypothetical protein